MTKLSQNALNKIAVAAKLGKSADIQSAVDAALGEINAKRRWQEELGEWIACSEGYFPLRVCYEELGAISTNDKNAIRVALNFYKNAGTIESWDARGYGWYRRKESDLTDINWKNADENPLDIKIPLELGKMANFFNGDIFIIAGESNAGKSAMCLNIVELNMNDWDCRYFSSQLSGANLKKRISFFETPIERWDMPAYDRLDNYHDALFPGAINIIDFLIITDNFWEIGTKIKDIHHALRKTGGIAIVAIQKSPYKEYGRGGDITKDLATLYITLSEAGMAKIIKLKDPKTEDDPNNQICEFTLENASYFKQKSPWYDPTQREWWKK